MSVEGLVEAGGRVSMEVCRRQELGTKRAKRLRKGSGLVPAVVYSDGDEGAPKVTHISVKALDVKHEYLKKHIVGRVFDLKVEGEKKPIVAVLYDFSLHPVTEEFEHIEFREVKKTGDILARVPVVFTGHSLCLPVKRGAFLNVLRNVLTVECKFKDYKESINIDLGNAALGQTYRISDLPLPSGCRVRHCTPNTLVARFMGKRSAAAATEEAAAGAAKG